MALQHPHPSRLLVLALASRPATNKQQFVRAVVFACFRWCGFLSFWGHGPPASIREWPSNNPWAAQGSGRLVLLSSCRG